MVAQLSSDAGGARLVTSENKTYSAPSIEQLAREALGWELPLVGLRYWVLGQTAPGAPVSAAERDAQGRLTRFVQNSWQVQITSYAGAYPSRMQMNYGGNLEIRLAIDEIKPQ